MDMNLQNHPKFQAMSPEAQKIAVEKYSALSPEAQQIVNKKLYAVPENVKNEAPLKDVGSEMVLEAAVMGPAMNMGFEAGSSALGAAGKYLAKPGQAEARLIADEMMTKFKPQRAAGRLREVAESMLKKPQEKIAVAQKAIADTGIQMQAEKEGLQGALKASGQRLGHIEENIGIKFKGNADFEAFLRNPKKVAQFSEQMEKVGSMAPEELAAKHSLQDLQAFRKTAQEATKKGGLSDLANASMQKGRENAAKALELKSKEFGLERKTYHSVLEKLDKLPQETKGKQVALRKLVIDERTQLTALKQRIAGLQKKATSMDASSKARAQAEAHQLIREGIQKDKTIKWLMGVAGIGAAASGYGILKG